LKSCPKCQRVYPNDAGFCPADGTALVSATLAPPPMTEEDPRIGKRLCNRYEIRRVVADGGMGRVYEGIDRQNDVRIAVKVLHDNVSSDEVSLERFKREYELASKLPHDHIVNVFDFQRDEAAKVWLLVMEFLDGEELRVVLKREKFIPPERLVRMLSQVAIGLDEAHSRQFIHRDLKPDNLFLCGTREGDEVKILDFGSVKDKNKDAKKLTVLGTTIGSPYYMAPEQAQGLDTLDARADVFALAAIAYECMCGVVPFPGSNGPSILLAILTKDPDPPSLSAPQAKYHIPPKMDEVMEEALAKNPNIRTKTVGALADAIGQAYGLVGDHRQWAKMPQAVLAQQIAEAKPRVMAAKPAAVEVAADPFAAPAPTGGPAPGYGPPPQQYAQGMDQAFANVNAQQYGMAPAGVPQSKPVWIIPVIVAAFVLVVGGGIAVFALMR
jgi:tRNA A-37 threonylcarbamoyl transferase component Bud32